MDKIQKKINFLTKLKMSFGIDTRSDEIEMDLNFRTYKVVGTIRNNNRIVAVDLLKCNGETQRVQVDKFKRILATNNNVFITNAKLSSDNRLLIS